MKRAIEKYVEDPLSEEILRGNILKGQTVKIQVTKEKLKFKAED